MLVAASAMRTAKNPILVLGAAPFISNVAEASTICLYSLGEIFDVGRISASHTLKCVEVCNVPAIVKLTLLVVTAYLEARRSARWFMSVRP